MPKKGFKSVTIKEDIYNTHMRLFQANREYYYSKGIVSFAALVEYLLDSSVRHV